MPLKSVSLRTFGCRVNAFESAALADAARRRGLKVVGWGEAADFALVNSCALTLLAEAKTRQDIRIFARKNPDSPIAVTGCLAQTNPEELAALPNVKWIIDNARKMESIDIVLANPVPSDASAKVFVDFFSRNAAEKTDGGKFVSEAVSGTEIVDRVNIKIQDGCDNACSYCIIPRARGFPRSRNFDDILADARALVSRGARELIVTGINISKFSGSRGSLADLLDELDAIPELLRIRIGSVEPMNFDFDAVCARMADPSHKLAPHLHISAQSLSDKVLAAMRRRYTAEEFLEIVARAKKLVPDISIGADIICGHPEEDAEEFAVTKSALPKSGLAYAHVFTFSPRPQTLAATMENVAPPRERKARADDLRRVAAAVRENFMRSQLGKTRRVLLENRLANGDYLAHTDNFLQIAVNIPRAGLRNRLADVELKSLLGAERIRGEFDNLVGE